jgi:hypothetical protein
MVVVRSMVWIKDGIEVQGNSLKSKFELRAPNPHKIESETKENRE